MKNIYFATFAAVLVGACASAPEVDPIIAPIVDKTLTHSESGATVVLGSDGSIKGAFGEDGVIAGAYEIRDGKYCSTITQPEARAGTRCQTVVIGENSATFDDGSRVSTWLF